jgi:serine protease inhibitor
VARHYAARARGADFAGFTEPARVEVNSWVSGETKKRTRELISLGALNSATRMVLHQVFIAVEDDGSEAAAATSVIMVPTSAMPPDLSLVVDRPFAVVISDLRTQQVQFLGRVVDPNK